MMNNMAIGILFVLVVAMSFPGTVESIANNTKELHIIALVPFIYNDRFGYKNAVDMATDDVNNRSDILKDYKIKIHFGETFVSLGFSILFVSIDACMNALLFY